MDHCKLASSLLVLTLCCSKLPLSLAADNDPQPCKPRSVLVDVKDNTKTYDIPYSVCAHPHTNPVCCLSEGNDVCDEPTGVPGVGKISKAELYMGDSGKIQPLTYDRDNQTFNHATLKRAWGVRLVIASSSRLHGGGRLVPLHGGSFTEIGVFNWIVSYKYKTDCDGDFSVRSCTCQVNLTLTIAVDDLELHLDSGGTATMLGDDSDETKYQYQVTTANDGVVLRCLSGLQDRLTPLRFKFMFTTRLQDWLSINEDYNKTVWCNEINTGTVQYGNWLVTRQDDACLLQFVNFSQADNGTYGCTMYHPDSNTHYNDDLSNSIQLISPSDMTPASIPINAIFAVTLTIGALFAASIIFTVSGYYGLDSCRKRAVQHVESQHLAVDQHRGFGTFTQERVSDLSRPPSPGGYNLASQASAQEEGKKPKETVTVLSSDTEQTQEPVDAEPQEQKSDSDTSSSADLDQPDLYSDDQLTSCARAGEQETPPCKHRGTCDNSLLCRYCRIKTYCVHQYEYYVRHEKNCKGTVITDRVNPGDQRDTGSESDSTSNIPSIQGSGEQSP